MKLPVNYEDLTWQERRRVREEYIRKQYGICYYCLQPLESPPDEKILSMKINNRLFPEGFFNHSVHLHHCHVTGMTIGAVHAYCNAVLWQYHKE